MTAIPATPRNRRNPALILVAGSGIVLMTFGVRNGFGLFMQPVSAELGWAREIFAFAIALQNLVWGLAQPLAGMVADRYGAARVLSAGGIAYAAGLALMSRASTPLDADLTIGVLVGLGMAGAGLSVVLSAVARAVPEAQRSKALGVVTAAGSLGQFLMVPLGQAFLGAYGWSTALLLLAVAMLSVLAMAPALAGRPEVAADAEPQSLRQALAEAHRHPGYLLLIGGFFVCGFHLVFIATHLPAFVVDHGLPAEVGAWAMALVGLFNVVGSVAAGALGTRRSKKSLLSLLYLARAAVILIFVLLPVSAASVLAFAAAMGLLWLSTVPLTSGLVAQMFGTRYMATLFGIVFLSHQIGSFLGAWLGGIVFDATGSYDLVWWVSVALGVFAALMHWPIDERPVARLAKAR